MILTVLCILVVFGVQVALVIIACTAILTGIQQARFVQKEGLSARKKPIFDEIMSLVIMLATVGIWAFLEQRGVKREVLVYGSIAIYPWVSWWWCQWKSGTTLFDTGRLPSGDSQILLGALVGIFAVFCTVLALWHPETMMRRGSQSVDHPSVIAAVMLLWSCTLLLIRRGLSGLQLRSNGLLYQGELIRWSRIQSYQWQRAKRSTLRVRYSVPVGLGAKRTRIAIPVDRVEAITQVLAQQAPNATSEG
jgi:hypothetical protein